MKTPQKPVSLWQNRDYLLLWSGQLVSTVGSGISQIAYPLLALAITHSPAQTALVGALNALAYILFVLPAGALLDRWNRKQVMIYCDIGRALCLAGIPLAFVLGSLTILQICIVAFISGSLGVFFDIAELACLPQVVSKEQLPEALGRWQASAGAMNLIGPPLGGVLFALRAFLPFLFDAISYTASVCSLLFIRVPFQEKREIKPNNLWTEVIEGVRWLWHQPFLRTMSLITSMNVFFGAGTTLIVIVIAQHYHAPNEVIGLIFSTSGVGSILGAALAGRILRRFSFAQILLLALWLYAILWIPIVTLPPPLLLGTIELLISFIGPVYSIATVSRRLTMTPDKLQSRINSSARLIILGSAPFGQVFVGLLLQYSNIQITIIILVIGQIILATVAMLIPAIRHAPATIQAERS
jgi:MFS family permease